jgi:hypothetical protein
MNDKIEEVKEFLESLTYELGQDMNDEEITYFAHLFTGVMCSSLEARCLMNNHISKISEIIRNDLGRVYN